MIDRARRFLAVGLALLAAGLSSPAAAAGGPDRLNAFLETVRTFRAGFVQTIHYRSGRKPQQSSGVVLLSRPGKFRWQVEKPFQQLLVGDGAKVWLYDPDLRQVTVRRMADTLGGTPAAILAGEPGEGSRLAIDRGFAISDGGEREGLVWAEAKPRGSDASFQRVSLGFRGEQLAAMEMHDNFGQVTRVDFSAVERNPAVAAALFRFNPPAGVDVVGE